MKQALIVIALFCVGCRDKPDIIDRGGKSLDVPVPSRGVAGTPVRGAEQELYKLPARAKMDPSRLGARTGKYGVYLVDGGGRALYVFSEDAKGETACFTNCATVWPPMIARKIPKATDGVDAAKVAFLARPDGAYQVSYGGLPLYYSDSDLAPDDVWGHSAMSFGGRFLLVGIDGKPLPIPKSRGQAP